jgi:hypothetical protein
MKVISSKRIKYRSHTKTTLTIIGIIATLGVAVSLETASIFTDTAFAEGGGSHFCTTSPSGAQLCTGGGGGSGVGGSGGGGAFASGTCDSGTPECTAHGGAGHGTGVGGSGSGGSQGPQPSFDVNP